jgi:undecaprenyl-diphosphatase
MRRVGLAAAAGAALFAAVVLAALRVGETPGALSDWQALVLGAVQGFTELLPISSSGHLILVPWIANWRYLEEHDSFNKTFDVALHLGTLIAVVVYFRRDIGRLIVAWVRTLGRRAIETPEERLAWCVAIATIPGVIVGAALENVIDRHLGEPWQIAIFLAVFAVVLYIADRTPQRRGMERLSFPEALAVGFAQALALMPGVSRSGISISAGRFLGLDRDSAARFSFLLLIPITLGAVLYKGVKDVAFGDLPPGSTGPFVVGVLTSAATGALAIWLLLGYVRRHSYTLFVVYRLVLAALILIVIATGARAGTF